MLFFVNIRNVAMNIARSLGGNLDPSLFFDIYGRFSKIRDGSTSLIDAIISVNL